MKKKPPILTTDGQPIVVAMTLYAFDTCQSPMKLQTLKAIDVDLGLKREVKLRRSNNREWSWSSKDRQGVCRSQNHMLYADKKKAEAEIAKRVAATKANERKQEIKRLKTYLKGKRDYLKQAKSRVAECEREIKDVIGQIKNLQGRA